MPAYREERLGRRAAFLLPSLKLKEGAEDELHRFLLDNFGGYTAAAGNIFGYWKDASEKVTYGEHREFTVAVEDHQQLENLKAFLGGLARKLEEESIYVEIGGESTLIFGE